MLLSGYDMRIEGGVRGFGNLLIALRLGLNYNKIWNYCLCQYVAADKLGWDPTPPISTASVNVYFA